MIEDNYHTTTGFSSCPFVTLMRKLGFGDMLIFTNLLSSQFTPSQLSTDF